MPKIVIRNRPVTLAKNFPIFQTLIFVGLYFSNVSSVAVLLYFAVGGNAKKFNLGTVWQFLKKNLPNFETNFF